MSYHEMSVSDSCSGIGPTIMDTIIAIPNSADLSSVYAEPIASTPATYLDVQVQINTFVAPFNMADMLSPPLSAYSRQLWCVSALSEHANAYTNDTWWTYAAETLSSGPTAILVPSNYTCPTTDPYSPLIYFPSTILQNIYSDWASCSGNIDGYYDPPVALTPQATAAAVTRPSAYTTTAASPSSNVPAPTPMATPVAMSTETAQSSAQPSPVSQASHDGTTASPSASAEPVAESTADPQAATVGVSSLDADPSRTQEAASDPITPGATIPGNGDPKYDTSSMADPQDTATLNAPLSETSQDPSDPPLSYVSSGPTEVSQLRASTTDALSVLEAALPTPQSAATAHPGDPGNTSNEPAEPSSTGTPGTQLAGGSSLGAFDPPSDPPATLSIGDRIFAASADSFGDVVLHDSATTMTVSAGGSEVYVAGQAISIATSGQLVVGAESYQQTTYAIASSGPLSPSPVSFASGGSSTAAIDQSAFIEGSLTTAFISAEGSATMVPATEVAIDTVHGVAIASHSGTLFAQVSGSASTFVPLQPGQATVIGGQTISVDPSGAHAIIDGSTTLLATNSPSGDSPAQSPSVMASSASLTTLTNGDVETVASDTQVTGTGGIPQAQTSNGVNPGTASILPGISDPSISATTTSLTSMAMSFKQDLHIIRLSTIVLLAMVLVIWPLG